VDGTLIEAWASHKNFRPKDGSGDEDGGANFHGQQRKNDTHASISERLGGRRSCATWATPLWRPANQLTIPPSCWAS
jgi:hypothetical protein